MLISNVHKSIIVMNSPDTRFSRNVFRSPSTNLAARVLLSLKPLAGAWFFSIPIKHCCLRFKHYNTYLKKYICQVMQQYYNTANAEETSIIREHQQQHCYNVVDNHLPKILQNTKSKNVVMPPNEEIFLCRLKQKRLNEQKQSLCTCVLRFGTFLCCPLQNNRECKQWRRRQQRQPCMCVLHFGTVLCGPLQNNNMKWPHLRFCGENKRTTVNFFIFFLNSYATPTNLVPG